MTTNYTYMFWAPTMIRDGLHVSDMATGVITGIIALVAMLTILGVGGSSDRSGERRVHAAVCAAVSGLGCLGVALIDQPLARVVALALVFIGIEGFLSPFWCVPASLLHGSAAAAAIALVNAIGNTGGFVGPYVVGVLKDATGSTNGSFLALGAITLGAAALCLMLRSRAAAGGAHRVTAS
jgi:ACS family tartrate transporter-like MFS transporter